VQGENQLELRVPDRSERAEAGRRARIDRRRWATRRGKLASVVLFVVTSLFAAGSIFAQTCPTEVSTIDAAKSNKLYLYFPTAADSTFPNYGTDVSPLASFDVASLSAGIGTTAQLMDEIHSVVVDDYCEFNVQVLETTTNPSLLVSPPARRVTVGIGADSNTSGGGFTWGQAQEVDIGDSIVVDFARVWAGTYTVCEGGPGPTGSGTCSTTGSLTGANATLLHWGQAIGGTAAHEAGHTYGLAHTDDDPPNDPTGQAGLGPAPGEDAFDRHLMPTGYDLTGPDRTNYRRHFSDRDYGILATNIGLSIETMHNWDLVNPNAQQAASLVMDFLSPLPSINIAWFYNGSESPWLNPTVAGPLGTASFKGTTYNKFQITWAASNPAWNNPSPGVVAGGAVFHVGATFTGVDFNQPDPIIIQDVTLLDASSNALALHPRLPSYDAGTLDSSDGQFALRFVAPVDAPDLRLEAATIYQLPQLAAIDSLVDEGRPVTRDGRSIEPWASTTCGPATLREGVTCLVASRAQKPHVEVVHRLGEPGVYDCSQGIPPTPVPGTGKARDSTGKLDYEGPICAGTTRDPFPSAVVYVVASFVQPSAKHYDPAKNDYVVGPVTSKIYYQFAGIRKLDQSMPTGVGPEGPLERCCVCLLLVGIALALLLLLGLWLLRRTRAAGK
jgi:hypothetical protein